MKIVSQAENYIFSLKKKTTKHADLFVGCLSLIPPSFFVSHFCDANGQARVLLMTKNGGSSIFKS